MTDAQLAEAIRILTERARTEAYDLGKASIAEGLDPVFATIARESSERATIAANWLSAEMVAMLFAKPVAS